MCVVNEFPDISFFIDIKKNQKQKKRRTKLKRMWLKTRLAEAQNWRCCWCGCVMTEIPNKENSFTFEHLLPKSKGGSNKRKNLVISCHECNHRRKDTRLSVFYKMCNKVSISEE